MNLLNKLTIKNLILNKKRSMVTAIGIVLSVALITAVASIYASGVESLISYEIQENGDFHVEFLDVPENEISTIRENDEVEEVYITQGIGYAKIDSKNEYKPYSYITAFTESSLENLAINLTEGRLPENDTEIVIPTHLKTNGRVELNIGDTITLEVGIRLRNGEVADQMDAYEEDMYEEIIDTETKTYTIVGIIERPSIYVESYSAPGYTFITYLDENNLTGNVNVYTKFFKNSVEDAYRIAANILGVNEDVFEKAYSNELLTVEEENQYFEEMDKAKYEFSINSYLIEIEASPLKNNTTGSLISIATLVCGIIVFTSVFCIKNSFDISITEKIKQYGMLKSMGATKKQIRKNVLFEGAILGAIAIPIGILFGFLASFVLVIISNYYLTNSLAEGFTLSFVFSWEAVLIAVLLGILTIYLSSIKSARRAAKTSPIESIRNSGNIKIKAKSVKTNKLIHKIFGVGGDISYKNLKRNKKKYRTTVISITVSVLVFIALYSFIECAFATVDNELTLYDYDICLSVDNVGDTYNKALETLSLDNIEDYSIYSWFSISVENPQYSKEYMEKVSLYNEYGTYVMIASVEEYQYQKYVQELGLDYEKVKEKGILVYNKKVYGDDGEEYYINKLDYDKGDIISGTMDYGQSFQVEIAYITEKLPFGINGRNDYMPFIIVSDEYYDKFKVEETPNDTIMFFYKSDNPDKLQDDIDVVLADYQGNYDITNIKERAQTEKDVFILIGIFLYGFIIVISLIGVTNIFNTITTNMELRKREFAMLKSIGMTKNEFNKMINLESIFMGTKSLFWGIIIGTILSYAIYSAMSNISFKLPIFAIVVSIVAVFLLIFCIMRYSMNKINKQNIIETIRNENI